MLIGLTTALISTQTAEAGTISPDSTTPTLSAGEYSYTGSKNTYQIDQTGRYTFTAYGAAGGDNDGDFGGAGAEAMGAFDLNTGDLVTFLIGGGGGAGSGGISAGGGGGSFIVGSNGALVVAGGGGGAGAYDNGASGQAEQATEPSSGGAGGDNTGGNNSAGGGGGGGGGLTENGVDGQGYGRGYGGQSYDAGGQGGGSRYGGVLSAGGFGGGGGAGDGGAGGGGGYAGGNGGYGVPYFDPGTGGFSFVAADALSALTLSGDNPTVVDPAGTNDGFDDGTNGYIDVAFQKSVASADVPEPSPIYLLALGLLAIGVTYRRRKPGSGR